MKSKSFIYQNILSKHQLPKTVIDNNYHPFVILFCYKMSIKYYKSISKIEISTFQ